MENNCLVTKLKANVNDNSLLRMGEMRIKISSIESPNEYSQSITLGFSKSVDLEIIGEGYFTDATLSANNGKKMTASTAQNVIYFSNGNYEIAVLDKYAITGLLASKQDGKFYSNKVININDFEYSNKLGFIVTGPNNLTGDISALSGLTSLTQLRISNNNLTGDISALSGLTSLTVLELGRNNLTGDISALSGLTSLTTLSASRNNLTGDISALSGLTSLVSVDLINNANIKGDITSLKELTSLKNINLGIEDNYVGGTKVICSNITSLKSLSVLESMYVKGINIQGDMSLLSAKLLRLINDGGNSNCSWGNSRPSSSNVFAIIGINIDNIDGMLNDFNNCVVPSKPSSVATYSTISVYGSRTSASDAAVSSLKSKGYTIKVNGVAI